MEIKLSFTRATPFSRFWAGIEFSLSEYNILEVDYQKRFSDFFSYSL